jgi:hypothetical protein
VRERGRAGGVALVGGRGQAYDEATFHYLLLVERKRARRSGRPFVLLFVDLDPRPPAGIRIHHALAVRLFSALWECLRETDIVGWYRKPRVAGVLLADVSETEAPNVGRIMSERIGGVLGEVLPSEITRRMQVRVYRHRELFAGEM